jgi:hypothetical protein
MGNNGGKQTIDENKHSLSSNSAKDFKGMDSLPLSLHIVRNGMYANEVAPPLLLHLGCHLPRPLDYLLVLLH